MIYFYRNSFLKGDTFMWKKAKDRIIKHISQPFNYAKKTKTNIVILLASVIMFLVTLIMHNNALTLVLVVLSSFVALLLLVEYDILIITSLIF